MFCRLATLIMLLASCAVLADVPPDIVGPKTPQEELSTFELEPGFKIELVASEPNIIDPVAMCFDEYGRLFVCEMRGYPNGGVGTGNENRGRIRCLRDKDGDGVFETSSVFAEGLRFPMGVVPWKGGVIVAVAPSIVFYPDANNDDKAEAPTVLYDGFNLANIQQMVNSLQWAADGWIHGMAGNAAGTIHSPQAPNMAKLPLQARGFRFRPDVPGSMEPMSGGGQYGLTCDDAGHWFTATNSQHLRQIIIQDRYLRGSSTSVTATTLDIPEHGAACKVFRISPFEAWRLERTTRRVNSEMSKRLPSTELVPGGFATSACSPVVYTADLFQEAYRNNVFICDPANNVIMRDTLHEAGARFTARRGREGKEFLASTDNWFRPTQAIIGPDGALYVLDFYREVIETPLSLPDDIKAKLNLESRQRGRIWRIAPEGFKPGPMPNLKGLKSLELAFKLTDANYWTRCTAQRMMWETQLPDLARESRAVASSYQEKPGVEHSLALLHRLNKLDDVTVLWAIRSNNPTNRIVGLRYYELMKEKPRLLEEVVAIITKDPSPMVRFQLALSCKSHPKKSEILSKLMQRDAADPWIVNAIMITAGNELPEIAVKALQYAKPSPALDKLLNEAGMQLVKKNDVALLLQEVSKIESSSALQFLKGVAIASRSRGGVAGLLKNNSELSSAWAEKLKGYRHSLHDEKLPLNDRVTMAGLLGAVAAKEDVAALLKCVQPQEPIELQLASVQGLGQANPPELVKELLAKWPTLGPAVRREVVEQCFQSPVRLNALLDAVEAKQFATNNLESTRLAMLKSHPNAAIKQRAAKLLQMQTSPRANIVKRYEMIDFTKSDLVKGQALFKQHCATCHKVGDLGQNVGPQLEAVITGKTPQDLVTSIFDPNKEVDPRYVNYLANTTDGKSITGIVTSESGAAVTLTRAEGVSETIRRADLESLRSTGVSLMPEGFENSLTPTDTGHLIAFLMEAVKPSKLPKK